MVGKRNLRSRFSISGLLSGSNSDIPKISNPSPPSTSSTLAAPTRRPPQPPPLAPGDRPTHIFGRKVSPEEVRELHELIRRRCELDVWIWGKRKCHQSFRHHVQKEMDRSDAALAKIITLVQTWDAEDAWESKEDHKKLKEVRKKLEEGGKRNWAVHPPWEEEYEAPVPVEGLNLRAAQRTLAPFTPPSPQTYTPFATAGRQTYPPQLRAGPQIYPSRSPEGPQTYPPGSPEGPQTYPSRSLETSQTYPPRSPEGLQVYSNSPRSPAGPQPPQNYPPRSPEGPQLYSPTPRSPAGPQPYPPYPTTPQNYPPYPMTPQPTAYLPYRSTTYDGAE